ncbi:hypothetical protein U0070_014412 [Myodes glareolus]|uniref:Uncharacterized protein n=1 Tax=Myodes glareolus TaxID=447135 RepID=A0AAW0J702_MYOGA
MVTTPRQPQWVFWEAPMSCSKALSLGNLETPGNSGPDLAEHLVEQWPKPFLSLKIKCSMDVVLVDLGNGCPLSHPTGQRDQQVMSRIPMGHRGHLPVVEVPVSIGTPRLRKACVPRDGSQNYRSICCWGTSCSSVTAPTITDATVWSVWISWWVLEPQSESMPWPAEVASFNFLCLQDSDCKGGRPFVGRKLQLGFWGERCQLRVLQNSVRVWSDIRGVMSKHAALTQYRSQAGVHETGPVVENSLLSLLELSPFIPRATSEVLQEHSTKNTGLRGQHGSLNAGLFPSSVGKELNSSKSSGRTDTAAAPPSANRRGRLASTGEGNLKAYTFSDLQRGKTRQTPRFFLNNDLNSGLEKEQMTHSIHLMDLKDAKVSQSLTI